VRARLVGSAFGERVLDHLEGGVCVAQLGSQLGDLGYGDTPVVDGEDRVGLVYVSGDLGDRHGLLISVHWAPVPVLCARRSKIGQRRRRGSLVACELALCSDARRGRLLDDVTCAAWV